MALSRRTRVQVMPPSVSPSVFADSSSYLPFDDLPRDTPSDSMLFSFDYDDVTKRDASDPFSPWDGTISAFPPPSPATFSASPASTCSQLDLNSPSTYSPHSFPATSDSRSPQHPLDYSSWLVDDLAPTSASAPSAPIAIPPTHPLSTSDTFVFGSSTFDKLGAYSPSLESASLDPLSVSYGDQIAEPSYTTAPSLHFSPFWSTASSVPSQSPLPQLIHPPPPLPPPSFNDDATTIRQRHRRNPPPVTGIFQSSSAPSDLQMRPPIYSRAYSRRSESVSVTDDFDATVRRKRKADNSESMPVSEDRAVPTSQRSHLRPPKLAPSTWQLWFADWIQRQQATSDRKLNVAQAAKEAGAEYALLSAEEKEPYQRRSQQLKEIREREHAMWMSSLKPEDIKRENNFRAAQRKAGKSRKGNMKDPNAPKKPLSAYFNFIASIRNDPALAREVFGDETETTRQSVLAAQKWRSMSDEEKRPFLAQAEQDRLEYEAAKKLYDEATTGHKSGVSFSVLQGGGFIHSMLRPAPSAEPSSPESESEGFMPETGSSRPGRRLT